MTDRLADIAEVFGGLGAAVAVGMLAGAWWGVLAFCVALVVWAEFAGATPSVGRDEDA